jgi:hypothetical protein
MEQRQLIFRNNRRLLLVSLVARRKCHVSGHPRRAGDQKNPRRDVRYMVPAGAAGTAADRKSGNRCDCRASQRRNVGSIQRLGRDEKAFGRDDLAEVSAVLRLPGKLAEPSRQSVSRSGRRLRRVGGRSARKAVFVPVRWPLRAREHHGRDDSARGLSVRDLGSAARGAADADPAAHRFHARYRDLFAAPGADFSTRPPLL